MTLDQVGIVAVHHPDELGELLPGTGMKRAAEVDGSGMNVSRQIREDARDVGFEIARLDPRGRFQKVRHSCRSSRSKKLIFDSTLHRYPSQLCRFRPPMSVTSGLASSP
ncbi:hypothetical protein [Methylobacterium sp. 77]|uniref:hypothetical protein n=1 Tax=Methylobacterium sp. 77 TaxID=1101192 RepID=UPI0012DDB0D7|nr:hypothetical protein [Methylobacterium sp. 77]